MKKSITIKLNEKDVQNAIKEWVKTHYQLKVKGIIMHTSVRGDYDKGNAEEYVEKVW